MSMSTSEQAYKINVKHPVYAVMLTDTEAGTTYGDVKTFGEAQQIQMTPSVSSGQLYGNGAKVDSSSVLTGITVSYQATKIPVEVQAELYNYTVTNGVIQIEAGKTANYIAFGYEIEQSNGKSEYVWLLKGRPKPMNETLTQSEDNITYSTDTIEIEFVKRVSDDMLKYFADLSNPDFVKTQADKWFTTAPTAPVTP